MAGEEPSTTGRWAYSACDMARAGCLFCFTCQSTITNIRIICISHIAKCNQSFLATLTGSLRLFHISVRSRKQSKLAYLYHYTSDCMHFAVCKCTQSKVYHYHPTGWLTPSLLCENFTSNKLWHDLTDSCTAQWNRSVQSNCCTQTAPCIKYTNTKAKILDNQKQGCMNQLYLPEQLIIIHASEENKNYPYGAAIKIQSTKHHQHSLNSEMEA